MSTKNNGITFQINQEKERGTPVWPTRKGWTDVLLGFQEFAVRNRDDKKLIRVLGYGLEAKSHEKVMAMYQKVAACGLDPQKAADLYDGIHGTMTRVETLDNGDVILVAVPGPEHNGVGFYTIGLWQELEWWDPDQGEWRTGYLSSLSPREEGIEVSEEEDPMSPTHVVLNCNVRRKEK